MENLVYTRVYQVFGARGLKKHCIYKVLEALGLRSVIVSLNMEEWSPGVRKGRPKSRIEPSFCVLSPKFPSLLSANAGPMVNVFNPKLGDFTEIT